MPWTPAYQQGRPPPNCLLLMFEKRLARFTADRERNQGTDKQRDRSGYRGNGEATGAIGQKTGDFLRRGILGYQ